MPGFPLTYRRKVLDEIQFHRQLGAELAPEPGEASGRLFLRGRMVRRMPKYIVHDDPAVVTDHQRIAMADLRPFGFPDLWEQIWLGRREDDSLFVMQCIPFRVYGLNLFDVLRLDQDDMLVEVVSKSGHRTLRALLARALEPAAFQAVSGGIVALAQDEGLALEWSGDRHVAIDVPVGQDSAAVEEFLEGQQQAGTLFWEWSDAQPFEAPQRRNEGARREGAVAMETDRTVSPSWPRSPQHEGLTARPGQARPVTATARGRAR
jgi:hypothetical protein